MSRKGLVALDTVWVTVGILVGATGLNLVLNRDEYVVGGALLAVATVVLLGLQQFRRRTRRRAPP